MRRLVLCALAACVPETVESWQLDHDRVVAVRSTPAHVRPGEVARLDGLIASSSGPVDEQQPTRASAVGAAADLFVAVHFNVDHWQIDGPAEEKLAQARAELGLADGDPVPLPLTLRFGASLYAEKIVWLGDSLHENPLAPTIVVDDAAVDSIELDAPHDVTLTVNVSSSRVRWLTSCGELVDDDESVARLSIDRACEGELAVVVRDELGGVAWRVVTIVAR